MIVGIGIDMVRVSRIRQAIRKWGGRFLSRVYTEQEQVYSKSFKRPEPHLAARFAVKEAFFKAMGTGWVDGVCWKDVEIYHENTGRPKIQARGKVAAWIRTHGITNVHISLSHDQDYSIGQVILSKG